MKLLSFVCLVLILASCANSEKKPASLSKEEMLRIVKECDLVFSIGVQKRDSAMLTNIYTDSAQYVTPKRPIMKGKTEIGKDWGGFLRMKEHPIDLILNIAEVRGTKDVIYETGTGYTLLADSTKWNFNYVNVWALQKDGTYKLEIDTYN